MPIGPYENFGECVAAQKKKGKSDESARKICGAMEQKMKQKKEIEDKIFEIQSEIVDEKLAKLSSKARKDLPKGAFAIPEKRAYPIHDRAHAANALSRVSQHGTPSEKARVRAAVCRKYPDLPACKKEKKKNEIVLKAMEMNIDLNIIEEMLNENTLKSKVESLLGAIIDRWVNSGAKKSDIDAFREAMWLYRDLNIDDKKGVIM